MESWRWSGAVALTLFSLPDTVPLSSTHCPSFLLHLLPATQLWSPCFQPGPSPLATVWVPPLPSVHYHAGLCSIVQALSSWGTWGVGSEITVSLRGGPSYHHPV